MPSPHLASTTATVDACRRCRTQVLTGLAEGLLAHADLIPLTVAGEAAVRAAGRGTYALGAGELIHLDDDRAAGHAHRLLLPEHVCGAVIPAEYRATLPGITPTP